MATGEDGRQTSFAVATADAADRGCHRGGQFQRHHRRGGVGLQPHLHASQLEHSQIVTITGVDDTFADGDVACTPSCCSDQFGLRLQRARRGGCRVTNLDDDVLTIDVQSEFERW